MQEDVAIFCASCHREEHQRRGDLIEVFMNYKNILIVKLSAIGDVIHALPVASAIKKGCPDAKITWIVEQPAYDLLTNNPNIDEIIIFDKKRYKSLVGLLKNGGELSRKLRGHSFDLALDLQGLFKSAAIALLSGANKRFVYCNARELSHLISQKVCGEYSEGHVIDRYLDVVRHLGIKVGKPHFDVINTAEEQKECLEIIAKAGLDVSHQHVILAPGTNWSTKCWPTKHYARLAELLNGNGIGCAVVGGKGDNTLAEEIIQNTSARIANLTGKTSLKQLAYIIRRSSAFVGGDTGPMHLAVAVGTPVVALFGPTDPKRNGPYGEGHMVLTAEADCVRCWQRKCDKKCMDTIMPEKVFAAVNETLRTIGKD